MKKFILILLVILFSGCADKERIVTNANGEAKTYQFFLKQNYNPEQYTLNLKNGDSKITIVVTKDKSFYQVTNKENTTQIIEKDGYKHTIDFDMKSYTTELIMDLTNYSLGYLPKDMEKLKTESYKTGKDKLTYEEYVYQGGSTTYYFKGDKLKHIKNKTSLNETTVSFVSISSKIDKKLFDLPKDYQEITY